MAVTQKGFFFQGLSTDVKPTTGISVNDPFLETDTGQWYVWSGAAWVPSSADFFDKFREFISWGSVDGFTTATDGGSVTPYFPHLDLRTGAANGNDALLQSKGVWYNILEVGKLLVVEWMIDSADSIVDQTAWLRLSSTNADPPSETAHHFGFRINGADISASNADGAIQTINDTLVDIPFGSQRTRLKAVLNPGTDCKYYVNGVWKKTHITNLPTAASLYLIMQLRTLEAANHEWYLGRVLLEKGY